MRFYTNQQPFDCGIDLPARTMALCSLSQDGEVMLHRNMQARPDAWLKALAPYRANIVLAVACLCTGYWLAALGAQAGRPFVLGHALYLPALHGGQANNDTIASQQLAVRLRGGLRPQASVSPAAMRAPRALLRRRWPLTRQRAALLAHIQHTPRQYHLPESGKKLAYKGKRDGVAARCPAPAAQPSVEGALALLDHEARLRSDVALPIVQTAKPHPAPALYRRQAVPGLGTILRVVLRYAMHEIPRFPRVPDVVASCRWGKGATEAAGKRSGPTGATRGQAYLQWAFSAAAVLCRRNQPVGPKSRAR